jgi:hypothetical protein
VAEGDGEQLGDMPVVLAFEYEDPIPASRDAREPQDVADRLRGGQRELPLRHPPAGGKLAGDGDGIVSRQPEPDSAPHAVRDGIDDRRLRMTGRGDGDAEIDIQVAMPVDVG